MIYPLPRLMKSTGKFFEFGIDMVLTISDDVENTEIFKELWHSFTFTTGNLTINKVQTSEKTAIISFKPEIINTQSDLNGYLYHINVMPDKAIIDYSDKKSLLYAFYTLLQIIEPDGENNFSMKCCDIYDKPAAAFRGIHICIFPETKLSFVKKMVKLAAFYKMTHVVLEFWGTLKYDALKELSWESGFTKEEIKPIIKSANDMGIEIIPMFNHLGHATQSRVKYGKHVVLDQNPKLQALFEPDGWTWCVSNPDTISLLRKIRRELIKLFGNCGYFHLGCDEAYSFASCKNCSIHNKSDLLVNYLNSVSKELSEEGIRGIIWGDQFLLAAEFKSPYIAKSDETTLTHEKIDLLDKNIIIDDWQYYLEDENTEIETTEYFMSKGFDVLLSPWCNQKNITAMSVNASKYYGVLGTTWDLIHERSAIIPQTASEAWSGIEDQNHKLLMTSAASILRKLSDKNRSYKESGFNETET